MSGDLFISYAWTNPGHREWVRLLAAHMKTIGYDVLIDADVDYGDGLSGFMRRAIDCRHVLLIADENYVDRADNLPSSGVGIENHWFSTVYDTKPALWLSVLFKDNPGFCLPEWLAGDKPRGHSFNASPTEGDFPGSEQVEDLWRWIEGLPANRDHAVTASTLRMRAHRLEVINRERDPSSWSNPALAGEVVFAYERSPDKTYSLGFGEFAFGFQVSGCNSDSVYVYRDKIHAVGLDGSGAATTDELAAQLTPGRTVVATVGKRVILQNEHGALCIVHMLAVEEEVTSPTYTPASVHFQYQVLADS